MNKKRNNILTIVLVMAIVIAIFYILKVVFNKNNEVKEEVNLAKSVEIIDASLNKALAPIELVGKVLPENQVDIVALSKGTIRSLMFDIGDEVKKNQTLSFLDNGLTRANLNSTQINYMNMLNSLDIAKSSADKQVRQVEIGLDNAKEAVSLAEISLASAIENRENNISLQNKGNLNLKDSGVISFYDFVNYIENTLLKINYIIHAEAGEQMAGIEEVLAVKNSQTLIKAKNDYRKTKMEFDKIKSFQSNIETVENDISEVIFVLGYVRQALGQTIKVLDSTIDSPNFPLASLQAEQNKFDLLFSEVIGKQNQAEGAFNGLENIDLNNETLKNSLDMAVSSAESQLEMAKSSLENAKTSLEGAKKGREQQILSAQIGLDNALSQLNVNREMYGDLTVKSPIEGVITGKFVDLGTEVSPGQKIAQVSKTDVLKIEINLSEEDVYKVLVGDKVMINDEFEAEISSINPSADPMTRKVKAEIIFDNKEKDLIPGTVVDISVMKNEAGALVDGKIFVPISAVSITQNGNFIFVALGEGEEKVAQKKIVEIGEIDGTLVEIISGLLGEEKIITQGAKNLKDGDKITVK